MAQSLEQFSNSLRASGIPFAAELDRFLAANPSKPKDGAQLARLLVKEQKLTAYQAQEIYAGRGQKLVLGNYVILDKLGQGGMGLVLKAEHQRMHRHVALKVLSPAAVKSADAVQRFQREVQAAAKLIHPNIVTAFDADEAHGQHFLVMEYVEGSDLSQHVKKSGPLPVDKALHCLLQAARGLEFAHSKGVVHRDIKPSNLLLDSSGTVKILDMGLARIESAGAEQAELTGTGQIMGTVDYMAPEQALNTRTADQRADIYALGYSLWYLLTGRAAYEGETVMEKLMAHQQQEIPSLAAARSDVSAELDRVFRRMVAKKPADRYQTLTEVLADLQACQGEQPLAPTLSLGPSEDHKLSQFLRGVGGTARLTTGAASPARAAAAPAERAVDTAEGERTILLGKAQAETDPKTQQHLPPVAPSRAAVSPSAPAAQPDAANASWTADGRTWAVAGGGLAGAALLVLLTAFGLPGTDDPPLRPTTAPESANPPTTPAAAPAAERDAEKGPALSSGPLPLAEAAWSAPENLGPQVNSPQRELTLALTDDELLLVFCRESQILMARRTARTEPFGPPEPLALTLEGQPAQTREGVSITGDGLLLTFTARDSESPLQEDICLAERASRNVPFGPAERLPAPINTPSSERMSLLSRDGRMLFFTRFKGGGPTTGEICMCTRANRTEPFGPPIGLGPDVNVRGFNVADWISGDKLTLVTTEMSGGNVSQARIHTRPAKSVPFGPGRSFRPPFATTAPGRAWISPDGERMYFHAREFSANKQNLDLWMVRRATAAP